MAQAPNALFVKNAAGKFVPQSDGSSLSQNLTATGNTLVKTGAGFFRGLTINTLAAGSSVKVYDGVDNTGKLLGTWSGAVAGNFAFGTPGIVLNTGLYVVIAGGTPDVTILYA